MNQFLFNEEKAKAATLHVLKSLPGINKYNFLKVFYFAEKEHLALYARPIVGDTYIAMKNGPVPSILFDYIKTIQGIYSWRCPEDEFIKSVKADGNKLYSEADPDLDELSATDIECLDLAIREYGNMDFGRLKKLSHDSAYEKADHNDTIDVMDIAADAGTDDAILNLIKENTYCSNLAL